MFKRKPDATTEEFRTVCERADKQMISKLSNREFNASYVLPLRRSKALTGRSRARKASPRPTTQPRTIALMKAQLVASTSIQEFLLDLGIADVAAHEQASKVARKIVNKISSL